jgi:hypothetical protein
MKPSVASAASLAAALFVPLVSAQRPTPPETAVLTPGDWLPMVREGIDLGVIGDPARKQLPTTSSRRPPVLAPITVSGSHLFPYEDTQGVLVGSFTGSQLFELMTDAANALIVEHGDDFDFIGYWMNFEPTSLFGAAFYLGIRNEVTGIGDPSTVGTPIFDFSADLGLASSKVQGYVMMYNVFSGFWAPGDQPAAAFTRLALAQEFEHRFAMYLPPLLDGRQMQGDNGNCGRSAHWNFKVDGQGSGMEIANWVGATPAFPVATNVSFNTDIPGGVFSYPDLYLMGYVSGAHMDAGMSEFRYMNSSSCFNSYNGVISTIDSASIIASAGPRVPDSASAQKNFRCGWVMIHQPGDPPHQGELGTAAAIMNQQQIDWVQGTLGLGMIDNSLFDDCNQNGVPDDQDIAMSSSNDFDGNQVPDECDLFREDVDQAAPGQSVNFTLAAGPDNANRFYWIFGSVTGTAPGATFPSGAFLPLNFDAYFKLTLSTPFAGIFSSFVGVLDAGGNATAALHVPPGLDPDLIGLQLDHAFTAATVFGIVDFASNAVPVTLTP